MTTLLEAKMIKFYAYEYYLKKESLKEYVDEETGIKYVSMTNKDGDIVTFLSIGLFERSDISNLQIEVTFDASAVILNDEEGMKLVKELMHMLLTNKYDIDEDSLYSVHRRFEDKRLVERFNKAGYSLFLGNCGDPYFVDDDDSGESIGFFMVKIGFYTEEEMAKLELMDEDDAFDYMMEHYDEEEGYLLV